MDTINETGSTLMDTITGVYKPQVDLFNALIERVNKAVSANYSLMEVLNSKFETTFGGTFSYDEETGTWEFHPAND